MAGKKKTKSKKASKGYLVEEKNIVKDIFGKPAFCKRYCRYRQDGALRDCFTIGKPFKFKYDRFDLLLGRDDSIWLKNGKLDWIRSRREQKLTYSWGRVRTPRYDANAAEDGWTEEITITSPLHFQAPNLDVMFKKGTALRIKNGRLEHIDTRIPQKMKFVGLDVSVTRISKGENSQDLNINLGDKEFGPHLVALSRCKATIAGITMAFSDIFYTIKDKTIAFIPDSHGPHLIKGTAGEAPYNIRWQGVLINAKTKSLFRVWLEKNHKTVINGQRYVFGTPIELYPDGRIRNGYFAKPMSFRFKDRMLVCQGAEFYPDGKIKDLLLDQQPASRSAKKRKTDYKPKLVWFKRNNQPTVIK